METYGKILLIAMPAFLLLILFEKFYGVWKGNDTVQNMDMISSLTSGTTNVTKDILGLSVAIITYPWLVTHLAIISIENTFIVYLIAFIALDFAGYWVHRIQHTYNIFWNNHIVHHSSEEFNLACALRQSISGIVRLFVIFLLPAALLGVPAEVIAVVAPLHLFAQFWYHTRHINKIGFLEHIIVSPSHHRVHHAINNEYLDKNFSQIFIFWDKIFGTFQEEMQDVPPVYGCTRPVQTWNPIKINFTHLAFLIRDAWYSKSWKDKFRIWLMPLGWRPKDVIEKVPENKIQNVYDFEKYNPSASTLLQAWSWFQMIVLLGFLSYFLGNIAYINELNVLFIYEYGFFIFVFVYALTDLMDKNRSAIFWEILKAITAFYFIYSQSDWFGLSKFFAHPVLLMSGYFIFSGFVTIYISIKNARDEKTRPVELTLST